MGALLTFPLELLCFAIPHRGRGLRFTQYRFAAAKLQDSIPIRPSTVMTLQAQSALGYRANSRARSDH